MTLFTKLKKSTFINSTLKLSSGLMSAQLLLILFSPVLTRLYTPIELGVYSSVLAIAAFATPVINGRFEFLIISAKNDKQAKNFAFVSLLICTIITAFIILIFLFLSNSVVYEIKKIGGFVWFIIPVLYLNGLINIFNQYNIRLKQYGELSKITFIRSIFQISSQTVFGLLHLGTLGLLMSILIGVGVGLRRQILISTGKLKNLISVEIGEVKNIVRENIKQIYVSVPASLINSIANNLMVPIVLYLFGAVASGYYFLANRILAVPIQLLGSTISKVYYEKACRERDKEGSCKKTFNTTVLLSSTILLPVFIILYFYSEPIFKFIFGEEWIKSAIIVKMLIPFFFIRGVTLSIIMTPYVYKLQYWDLVNQIIIIFNLIISLAITILNNSNMMEFFKYYSYIGSFVYIIVLALCWKLSRNVKGIEGQEKGLS